MRLLFFDPFADGQKFGIEGLESVFVGIPCDTDFEGGEGEGFVVHLDGVVEEIVSSVSGFGPEEVKFVDEEFCGGGGGGRPCGGGGEEFVESVLCEDEGDGVFLDFRAHGGQGEGVSFFAAEGVDEAVAHVVFVLDGLEEGLDGIFRDIEFVPSEEGEEDGEEEFGFLGQVVVGDFGDE